MKIKSVHATAVEVPVTRVAAYSKRMITHVAVTIVEVETDAGISGLGDGRGGLGLSLLVRPASRGGFAKCWTQSVRIAGRPTSVGLGRYPVVTLAKAREKALENARAVAEGRDPRRRAGEVRSARWADIDLDARVWTVPAEHMKAGRAHRVPLSDRALGVLDAARAQLPHGGGAVFPSPTGVTQTHRPMGDLMRALHIDAVPHGFRSSFRDWAAECTETPREVCELALAHVNSDRVEAAYRRSDLFERRRKLMQEWADYLSATA